MPIGVDVVRDALRRSNVERTRIMAVLAASPEHECAADLRELVVALERLEDRLRT